MTATATKTARRDEIDVEDKPQLLDSLYARLLQDCDDLRTAIVAHDPEAQAHSLKFAHAIVTELLSALDHSAAPELCANLSKLYEFVAFRLGEGCELQDPEKICQGEQVIRTLRAAFQEAACAAK